MKYKILTMDRKTLEKFNGKIIEILKKEEVDARSFEEYLFDVPIIKKEWILTCLVELENKKWNTLEQ